MQGKLGIEMGRPINSCLSLNWIFMFWQDTLIKYVTDGCMLKEVLADSSLTQYSVVVLDEVHERSLNTVCMFIYTLT